MSVDRDGNELEPGSVPTKWTVVIWRLPGLIAFIIYVLTTFGIVGCLVYDVVHGNTSPHHLLLGAIGTYAANSAIVAVPAALVSIVAGAYLAFRMRFLGGRHAIFPIIVLLAPFFSSPIALYLGLKLAVGAGPLAYAIGLTFRYLPICVIVLLVALYSIPTASKITLANLRVSEFRLLTTVAAPVMAPTAFLLFALLTLLMPLDVIGSTVAGGGKLQTFGNLILDYSHTRDAQATASLLTLGFLVVAASVLAIVITAGARHVALAFRWPARDALLVQPLRTVYLNPVFVTYVGGYFGILIALLFQSAAVGSQYAELLHALQTSAYIIAPMTIMVGIVAMFVGCWFHLATIDRDAAGAKFIAAALLVPTLLPPVLAGRMAAVAQGLLNLAGGDAAIAVWYMYFLGSVPILVMMGHPLVFDRALPKTAANHRLHVGDYVYSIVVPALTSAIVVGAGLFAAIAMSDAVIVRYIGGSTKTLGLVLENHQEGVLAPGDYVFMGALGLWTAVALVMCGVVMFLVQRRRAVGDSVRSTVSFEANTRS